MQFNNMSLKKYSETSGNTVYTPISSYQEIRKQEFNQRKWYNVLNKNEVV